MGSFLSSLLPPGAHGALDVRNIGDLRQLARSLARHGSIAQGPYNRHGETLLHLAAQNGNPSAVRMLVQAGADTEAADALGRRPLHCASMTGHKAALLALLECGAAVDATDCDGRTALALAAFQNNEACLRALLAANASAAAADCGGWQALHVAARGGSVACVRALLEAGADIEAADSYGRTALSVAAAGGKEVCVAALLAAGASAAATSADGRTALHRAAAAGQEACLRALLEAGAPSTSQDIDGRTALHWAASCGKDACLEVLVAAPDCAAALELRDDRGQTALLLAALFGSPAAIRCLVRAGADAAAGSRDAGKLPADLAQAAGHPEAAQLLLQLQLEQEQQQQQQSKESTWAGGNNSISPTVAGSAGAAAAWLQAAAEAQQAQAAAGGGNGPADSTLNAAYETPVQEATAGSITLPGGVVVVSSREAIDPLIMWIDSQLGGGSGPVEQEPSSQQRPGASPGTNGSSAAGTRSGGDPSRPDSSLQHLRPLEFRFSDLVIERAIGQGSFGRVYLARLHQTLVAVKVLLNWQADGSAAAMPLQGKPLDQQAPGQQQALTLSSPLLVDLRKEAATMAALRHPNCVQLMGICAAPAALVTEYCPRGSLFDLLQAAQRSPAAARQLTWGRRLHLAVGAAKGVLHLHTRQPQIIHRDLKSPNLLVDAAYTAKVCDFNLSRAVDPGGLLSTAGALNPRWLAPEVLAGGPATAASDVFSLGVVLWELLTWRLPWGDVGGNPWQLAARVIAGARPAVPPREELPGADTAEFGGLDGYVELMQRCWAADAAERPSSAEVAQELRMLLQSAARGGAAASLTS